MLAFRSFLSYVFVFATALVLVGCSWFGDKKKQPNELTDITQRVDIQRRWEADVGSGLSDLYRLMPPTLDQQAVYANDYKGRVYAFDRESGKRLWKQDLDLDVASGLGLDDNVVLIASLDGDIVALDKDSGAEQWRANVTSEVLAPPQSNGSVVVVQTNDGKLLGLDAKSGESLWSYTSQLPILTLRGTATPQVFGPNVITGFANGKLLALSAVDGTPYWERRIARPQGKSDIERVVDIDGSPVISGQLIYATSYNGTLSALTPRGDIVWSQSNSSYSSPVVIGNSVIVSTAEGWMKAFNAETGLLLWETKLLSGRKLAAPQNLAGFAVTADYEGYVHVFDTDSGAILDRFRIDSDGVRSPMVTDGSYLYVLGNDGVLASIAVYLFKS
ncbi:MAG: outer membrane protein assembly factor BamB [Cellvibrionaceae bacterium]